MTTQDSFTDMASRDHQHCVGKTTVCWQRYRKDTTTACVSYIKDTAGLSGSEGCSESTADISGSEKVHQRFRDQIPCLSLLLVGLLMSCAACLSLLVLICFDSKVKTISRLNVGFNIISGRRVPWEDHFPIWRISIISAHQAETDFNQLSQFWCVIAGANKNMHNTDVRLTDGFVYSMLPDSMPESYSVTERATVKHSPLTTQTFSHQTETQFTDTFFPLHLQRFHGNWKLRGLGDEWN